MDLTFTVEPGEILGLIGPNGAGKSSTIKMILDFIRPDSGEVRLFDRRMAETLKHRIGYLPEEKGLYQNLPTMKLILYLASLKGLDASRARARALDLLERTGMTDSADKRIKHLSKGMGQMIQLIVTTIHEPDIVILDEPFSGLDPVNTELTKTVIKDLRDQGKSIILSTHQMNQVEELCDRVLMINHGTTVLYGDLKETTAQFRRRSVLVNMEGEPGELPGVTRSSTYRDGFELALAPNATPMEVLDALRERRIVINRFEIATPSLHEIFLKLAGENDE